MFQPWSIKYLSSENKKILKKLRHTTDSIQVDNTLITSNKPTQMQFFTFDSSILKLESGTNLVTKYRLVTQQIVIKENSINFKIFIQQIRKTKEWKILFRKLTNDWKGQQIVRRIGALRLDKEAAVGRRQYYSDNNYSEITPQKIKANLKNFITVEDLQHILAQTTRPIFQCYYPTWINTVYQSFSIDQTRRDIRKIEAATLDTLMKVKRSQSFDRPHRSS